MIFVALVVAAWAVLHGTLFLVTDTSPRHGRLTDTDSYMRLVRVTELAESGGWYDTTIDRSNAPYGDELHWTRPFDVMVIAVAAPLVPLVGLKDALFWSGAAICPLIHLAALFALGWAVAPLFSRFSPLLVAAFMVQPALIGAFQPGKLDHHALQILLFILIIGFGLRAMRDNDVRAAAAAGVVAGLGIWVSVEILIPLGALVAVMGVRWIADRQSGAATGLGLSAATTAMLIVALAIERPPSDWASTELDRVSAAHLLAVAVLTAGWLGIYLADRRTNWATTVARRTAIAATAALVSVAFVVAVAPHALRGPEADIDPAIRPIWLSKVQEMQPLVPGSLAEIGPLLLLAGQAIVAVPVAIIILRRMRSHPQFAAWALFALLLVGYLALALQHARASTFLAVPASVVMVQGLLMLREGLERLSFKRLRGVTWGGATVASVAGFLVLGGVVTAASLEEDGPTSERCYIDDIAPVLGDPAGLGARPVTIGAGIDFGPQILHMTPHSVLAGPYHRNADGILDLHTLFTSPGAEPLQIVRERNVELLLVCPSPSERALYADPEPVPGSLYQQLVDGDPPPWVEPVELPEPLQTRFLLYRVMP